MIAEGEALVVEVTESAVVVVGAAAAEPRAASFEPGEAAQAAQIIDPKKPRSTYSIGRTCGFVLTLQVIIHAFANDLISS